MADLHDAPVVVPDPRAIARAEATKRAENEAEQIRQRMLASWGPLLRVARQISHIDTAGLRDAMAHLDAAHPGWRDWPGGA